MEIRLGRGGDGTARFGAACEGCEQRRLSIRGQRRQNHPSSAPSDGTQPPERSAPTRRDGAEKDADLRASQAAKLISAARRRTIATISKERPHPLFADPFRLGNLTEQLRGDSHERGHQPLSAAEVAPHRVRPLPSDPVDAIEIALTADRLGSLQLLRQPPSDFGHLLELGCGAMLDHLHTAVGTQASRVPVDRLDQIVDLDSEIGDGLQDAAERIEACFVALGAVGVGHECHCTGVGIRGDSSPRRTPIRPPQGRVPVDDSLLRLRAAPRRKVEPKPVPEGVLKGARRRAFTRSTFCRDGCTSPEPRAERREIVLGLHLLNLWPVTFRTFTPARRSLPGT